MSNPHTNFEAGHVTSVSVTHLLLVAMGLAFFASTPVYMAMIRDLIMY